MNESLITSHRDYARALAREISRGLPSHVEFDELAQAAELGLVAAASKFDPARGVAFTTFAYYRIRGAVFDSIKKAVGLPPALQRDASALAGQDDVLEAAGPQADAADDPEKLAAQFRHMVERLGVVFVASHAGDTPEPADRGPTADESLEWRELLGRVRQAVDALPDEEAGIIRMLYFEHRSMGDVGRALKKDKATICRRHRKALDLMLGMLSG